MEQKRLGLTKNQLENEFEKGSGLNGPCPLPEPGDMGTRIHGNLTLISINKQPIITNNNKTYYNYDGADNRQEEMRFKLKIIYQATTGKISIKEATKLLKSV